jgi:hypothetical protein
VENPTTGDLATRLFEIHTEKKDNANKSRKVHPVINIGDKVWLLRCNLKTNRLCDKLDFRHFGPLSVVKQINNIAFRLELSPSMKIHPIFHVSLLEPYKELSILGRFQVPPPLIEIEGQEKFEVSEILDLRIIQRKLDSLVQWQGYDVSERTWEPVSNLRNAPEMIQKFHRRYPEKPSSNDT